jgi:hypothetical protein
LPHYISEEAWQRFVHKFAWRQQAQDRDRTERQRREAADEARTKARAAIPFTTDFRPRMATDEVTHGEIAAAETATGDKEPVLTPAQAARLRTEIAEAQTRRETVSFRWIERKIAVSVRGIRVCVFP